MNRVEKRRQRKLSGHPQKRMRKKSERSQQSLDRAIQHYNAGDLPKAEDACRQILRDVFPKFQPIISRALGSFVALFGRLVQSDKGLTPYLIVR